MNQLLFLLALAAMVSAALYFGHQGLRLARINRMLAKVVKEMRDELSRSTDQSAGDDRVSKN